MENDLSPSPSILIVDDNIDNIHLLKYVLEIHDYSVDYSIEGDLALDQIEKKQPDLILLDFFLSDRNGVELCEEIKSHSCFCDIPILFVTASHEEIHLVEAFQAGAADYITKPFRVAELLARVKTHIHIRRQADSLLQSQEKLQTIITHLQEGILVIDRHGEVQLANPAAAQMFGQSLANLLLNPARLAFLASSHLSEVEICRATGEPGQAEITVADARWQDQPVSIVCLRDVSDRIQYRQKLEKSLIKQQKLTSKLKLLATTDELTGISNRRQIMKYLHREFDRGQRHGLQFSLLMVDVDHFKQVNDTYGHPVGDRVLQSLANHLVCLVRSIDYVGRFGGEEFMVVLPTTGTEEALMLAERLCQQVRNQPITTEEGPVLLTLSIGVATYRPADKAVPSLLKRADRALYQAKSMGRDRVCVYQEKVLDSPLEKRDC